jgi:hypothetical protein
MQQCEPLVPGSFSGDAVVIESNDRSLAQVMVQLSVGSSRGQPLTSLLTLLLGFDEDSFGFS